MANNILASMSVVLTANIKDFERNMAVARKGLSGFDKAGEKLSGIGMAMSKYVSAPIGLMGGLIVKTAGDFEASMNKMQAITGATGSELQALTDQAKSLGITTKYSASEAADAMTFLGMAGFSAAETMKAIPSVLDLAAASGMDLARSADVVSNVMGQFGIQAEDTARVTNVMAATISSSNTNLEQLSEAMKYLGPSSHALGVSIEDTAAIIGVLGDAGIQGSLAGRALGTSLVSLAKPTTKAADAMEALGVSAFDASGNFVGIPSLLKQIEVGSAAMTQQQKAGNLQVMLGAEAFQEINILLQRGSEAYSAYAQRITGTNKAQEMARKQSEGFNGALKSLQSAFEGLQLAIANSGLLDMATKMASGLADLLRSLAKTNPELLKIGTIAAAAAAAIGPLSLAIGGFMSMLPALTVGLGALGTALAALTGPIGLTVAAVAALGIAFVALRKDATGAVEKTTRALEQQKEKVAELDSSIVPLLGRYEELKNKANRNKTEQDELNDIIAKITQSVPGAANEFDKYGKAIGLSTDYIRDFVDAHRKMADDAQEKKLAAQRDRLKEIRNELARIEKDVQAGEYTYTVRTADGPVTRVKKVDKEALSARAEALMKEREIIRESIKEQHGMVDVIARTKTATEENTVASEKHLGVIGRLQEKLKELESEQPNASKERLTILNREIVDVQLLIEKYKQLGLARNEEPIEPLKPKEPEIVNSDDNPEDSIFEQAKAFKALAVAIAPASEAQKKFHEDQALIASGMAAFTEGLESMASGMADSFAGMISNFAASMGAGTASLKDFGSALLNQLSELGKQLGQYFVKMGLPMLVTAPAMGAALIAGGLALSAFSGSMATSAGGSSGGSLTPSVSTISGGYNPSYSPSAGPGQKQLVARVEGRDLVFVMEAEENRTRRTRG